MSRQCTRTACCEPAVATLSYQYADAHAWLSSLSESRDPHDYDLCERHAGRVSVPQGWRFVDRREAAVELTLVPA